MRVCLYNQSVFSYSSIHMEKIPKAPTVQRQIQIIRMSATQDRTEGKIRQIQSAYTVFIYLSIT